MLVVLKTFGRDFFGICCLRRRPQDLPASVELLVIALAGYGLASFALTWLAYPAGPALAAGAAECVLLAALNYTILTLRGLPGRWLQTTSAMAGTGLLFTVAAVPVFMGMELAGPAALVQSGLYFVTLFLLVWNVAVMAHILRHALDTSFATAVVAAVGYMWLIAAIIGQLLVRQPA